MASRITVRQVSYQHPGLEGSFQLGPVDADIVGGEFSFWVGHNGSGKTTLARILCGEIRPCSGTIEGLNGSAIHHRQSVGANIFPELRIRDHFRLLSRRADNRIAELRRYFPEFDGILNKYPDELSGGQLQLAAFATVVLEQHGLYIFDEVFNHLDVPIATRVIGWIREKVVSGMRAPCVVITHDLKWVHEFAESVLVFSQGKIVARLTKHDLLRDPDRLIHLVVHSEGRQP